MSFAVLGDEELSSCQVLEELNPDVICLGYDQQELGEDETKMQSNTNSPSETLRASFTLVAEKGGTRPERPSVHQHTEMDSWAR